MARIYFYADLALTTLGSAPVAQHTTVPVPKVLGFGESVVGPHIEMASIKRNQLS